MFAGPGWLRARGLIVETSDDQAILKHAGCPGLELRVPLRSPLLAVLGGLDAPAQVHDLAARLPGIDVNGSVRVLLAHGLVFSSVESENQFVRMFRLHRIIGLAVKVARDLTVLEAPRFDTQIDSVFETMSRMAGALAIEATDSVREDCERILRTAEQPFNLCLGSARPIAGWIAVDITGSDVRADIRWGLALPDASVQRIYAAHVLEHLAYPREVVSVLREFYRLLRDDGRLRIVVPDIERCLFAYVREDSTFFEDRKTFLPWARQARTKLEHFLAYAGAGAPENDLFGHKFGYDFETLEVVLQDAGFRQVVRSAYMQSPDLHMRIDDESLAASAESNGSSYSLFVDAMKTANDPV
jgi:predicted SAM-dependent methyltransferase